MASIRWRNCVNSSGASTYSPFSLMVRAGHLAVESRAGALLRERLPVQSRCGSPGPSRGRAGGLGVALPGVEAAARLAQRLHIWSAPGRLEGGGQALEDLAKVHSPLFQVAPRADPRRIRLPLPPPPSFPGVCPLGMGHPADTRCVAAGPSLA